MCPQFTEIRLNPSFSFARPLNLQAHSKLLPLICFPVIGSVSKTLEIRFKYLRILAMHGPKMSTFWRLCFIILLIHKLSKIWMPYLTECPLMRKVGTKLKSDLLVSGLKLRMWKNCRPSDFQFQLLHHITLFQCYCTFFISWPFVKKKTYSDF